MRSLRDETRDKRAREIGRTIGCSPCVELAGHDAIGELIGLQPLGSPLGIGRPSADRHGIDDGLRGLHGIDTTKGRRHVDSDMDRRIAQHPGHRSMQAHPADGDDDVGHEGAGPGRTEEQGTVLERQRMRRQIARGLADHRPSHRRREG